MRNICWKLYYVRKYDPETYINIIIITMCNSYCSVNAEATTTTGHIKRVFIIFINSLP